MTVQVRGYIAMQHDKNAIRSALELDVNYGYVNEGYPKRFENKKPMQLARVL